MSSRNIYRLTIFNLQFLFFLRRDWLADDERHVGTLPTEYARLLRVGYMKQEILKKKKKYKWDAQHYAIF